MKTAKRRMSQLLSALLLCSTVFSFGRIEAQAAVTGAWNTNAEGLKGQYQYIKWNSAGYKTSGHTDYDQATIVDAQSAPGVYQGINNTTFALDAPIATIFIDESKVHRVATKQGSTDPNDPAYMKQTSPTVWENEVLKVEELWHSANNSQNLQKFLKIDYNKTSTDNGFLGTGDGGYNYLMFDQKAAVQADTVNNRGLLIQQDNVFDGGIVRYTFKGAAEQNNKKMDVVITYSNLHIVLQNDIDNGTANNPKYGDKYKELNRFLICSGNDVRTHANAGTTGNNQRYGIKVDAKVQVLDGTDVVDGVFYFKAADIDVSREGTSFINLHDATNNRNYSEQIQIKSDGIVAGESYKLFIPGGDADKEKDTNGKSNAQNPKDSTLPGYKSIIKTDDSNQEWYRLEPQKDNQKVKDEQNSIYSGFLAAIDNTKGANVTVWSSGAGKNDNGENVSVETYLLAGNAGGKTTGVWYNLKSSTDTIGAKEPDKGGNIYTTNWGNKNGTPFTLGEGEKRLGPTTLTVSGGKTVTYSMIPNAAEGYVLKSLTESDGTIIYNYEGKSDEVLPSGWSNERKENTGLNTDSSGNSQTETLSYTVDVQTDPVTGEPLNYTFIFQNIQQDHGIHVVWQKKYKETYEFKMEDGSMLPDEIRLNLLPDRATPGQEKRFWVNEQIAPAAPKALSKVLTEGGQNYKYTFLRYEDDYSPSYTYKRYNNGTAEYYSTDAGGAAPRKTIAKDIHFTGYWKKTPAYTETYAYQVFDVDGTDITASAPTQVTDTKPDRALWYANGEKVYPAQPKGNVTKVSDGTYDYLFRSWDKNPATVNGANVAFLGVWVRAPIGTPTYTEHYAYKMEDGSTISAEVQAALDATLPKRQYQYFDGETVTAADPESSMPPDDLYVTVNGVTYEFVRWEAVTATVNGDDVHFVGVWRVVSSPDPTPTPTPDPTPQPDPTPTPAPVVQTPPAPEPEPLPENVQLTPVTPPQTDARTHIADYLLLLIAAGTTTGVLYRKKSGCDD